MVAGFLTRGFLIGESTPEALSALLAEAVGDDRSAEAGVRLVRGDVVDAGVVVLVVIATFADIVRRARRCQWSVRFSRHPASTS